MVEAMERSGAAEPGGTPGRTGMVGLAALFVAAVMALSAWAMVRGWPFAMEHGLPGAVTTWLWAGMALGLANILWGLWLLGQALRRAPRFARAFAAWHVFNIAALVALAGWTAVSEHFVFQPWAHSWSLARIAVGLVLTFYLFRGERLAARLPAAAAQRAHPLVYAINGLLAGLLGAGAGAAAGLLLGSVLADVLEVSCFEGGCGYFVLMIGLLAALAGFIAGVAAGLWLTGRPARGTGS